VLFDLDGTLLPMDQDRFVKAYFTALAKKLIPIGYDPDTIVNSVIKSTMAMIKNDGTATNEKVFWNSFSKIYGERVYKDIPVFENFYENEFDDLKDFCGYNKLAAEAVKLIKSKNYKLILATNPLFPPIATQTRARWAGLNPDDFEYITTYDNSKFCKPNPKYYNEILEKLGLKAEETLMVGNDISEDMTAKTLGIKVFLLTDCLINKNNEDISKYKNGNFEKLIEYIKKDSE
ncbi:MAG: HAD family hydrolase, partial [Clostridia bacterium]|nr:HAD family hydrolase [Clostridia bacterium]